MSHLRPFGATAYAHVPVDLNLSKLHPRSVKTALLGYFGQDGYKLLNRETGSIFRSRDVIFEEGTTHFTAQPANMNIGDDNDPFATIEGMIEPLAEQIQETAQTKPQPQNPSNATQQEIALRPLPMTNLHRNSQTLAPNDPSPTTSTQLGAEPSLATRRSRRDPRPTSRLKDSLEYLSRPQAFLTETDNQISITYSECHESPLQVLTSHNG